MIKRILSDQHIGVLARGASGSFVVNVGATVLAFLSQLGMARVLGDAAFGIYFYVINLLFFLVLGARLGFDGVVIRYLALYRAKAQWGSFRGLLIASHQLTLGAGIIVGACTAGIVAALRPQMSAELNNTLLLMCIALPIGALTTLRQSSLQALKLAVRGQISEGILRPVLLVGIAYTLVYLVNQPKSAATGLYAYIAATGIAYCAATFMLYRSLPDDSRTAIAANRWRVWFTFAGPVIVIKVAGMLFHRVDILMVGYFEGTTDAGYYGIASRISNLVGFALLAVDVIAAPMIVELYGAGRKPDLQRVLTFAAWGIFVCTIILSAGGIAFGRTALGLFGPGFTVAYPALVVLVFGQLFNALAGSVGVLMTMTGHQRQMAVLLCAVAVLNAALNAALIPRYGLLGAASATAITHFVWNAALLTYVLKVLSLNPTLFPFRIGKGNTDEAP